MKLILGIGLCLAVVSSCVVGHSQEVKIDLNAIAMIESSGNALAYNKSSGAVGKYQITLACLKDYNMAHMRYTYSLEEMYDPIKAEIVAEWYFGRIERYLKHYGLPVSIEYVLISYNWGIGNVRKWYEGGAEWDRLPRESREYVKKYNKLVN